MEYCEKGHLLCYLEWYRKKHKKRLPFEEKVRLMMEITSSMSYIHSRKIIHRDLKMENVLVDENGRSKLMDFGISKMISNVRKDSQHTVKVGTSTSMAPEVARGGQYNELCDVFSMGILVFQLFSEEEKVYGDSNFKVEQKIMSSQDFRPKVTKMEDFGNKKWLVNLMRTLWSDSPDARPSFLEIMEIIKKNSKVEILVRDGGKEEESEIVAKLKNEIVELKKIVENLKTENKKKDKVIEDLQGKKN